MSAKSADSDECTCKKICKCEYKAKKRLEKGRDRDKSQASSLRSRSEESRKKHKEDDSKKKRGSDDHKRRSDDHRRESDDHRRDSDDHRRGSDDRKRGPDDHKRGSDDRKHDRDDHKRKSDVSKDRSSISRGRSDISRTISDESRRRSEDSRQKHEKSKHKSDKRKDGGRHKSEEGSDLSIQGHSVSSTHRHGKKSPRKNKSQTSRSSQLSSIYEESERSTGKDSSLFHYVDSQGETRSRTSSMVENQKRKMKKTSSELSLVTFSPSSSEESAPTLRSSYWESAYSMHKDLLKTKEFLQTGTGVTLYDHLAEVIQKVVTNRIGDAVDFIESISKDVKEQRFQSQADKLRDVFVPPKNLCEVKKLHSLYKSLNPPEEVQKIDEIRSSMEYEENISEMSAMMSGDIKEPDLIRIPNFIESNNYFRQAGFGLPDWEIFDLTVSVTRLVKNMKNVFSKIRFFGKIFGLHKTYYILETELTPEEVERCKKIQYEHEQALLAAEKSEVDMGEPTSQQIEGIGSGEVEQEQEDEMQVEISHEELVRKITEKSEKARKEAAQRKSESQETTSARMSEEQRKSSAARSAEVEGSLQTGSGSVKTGSAKTGSSMRDSMLTEKSHSMSTYNTEDMIRETEEMAVDIIHGIVRDIMECIAIDILKSIEKELPILPPEPVNKWVPPKDVPQEDIGEGLNRTVFWVCNNLEDDWVCLPNVTPKHIDIARKITVGFTGNLDTELMTYPPFQGKEKEYLRAQLARINSATSVSPMGYYVRGIEGEDDDDDDGDGTIKYGEGEEYDENYDYEDEGIDIKRNPHYKTRSMSQLGNETMFYWVHHRKEIKKDGRITWWEDDDEDQVDEDMEDDGAETEHTVITNSSGSRMPRPLFKPLSREEAWIEESKVGWSISRHPTYIGGPTIVALRSLRWPGAVAYASADGKSDYMYIGWGLKLIPNGYRPVELPPFSTEYPTGEEIAEDLDPSVTDEEDQLEEGQPPLRPRKISVKRSDEDEGTERSGTYDGSTRNSEMAEEDEDVTDSKTDKSSDSEEE